MMNSKVWRAKYFYIRTSNSKQLVITVRRFKTAEFNRSKLFTQFVLPLSIGSIKEIAFKHVKFKPSRAKKIKNSTQPHWGTFANYLLITFGVIGIFAFSALTIKVKAIEPAKATKNIINNANTTKPIELPNAPQQKSITASTPTHITIASQNIQAPIIPVGQEADGSMQTPNPTQWIAGWYNKSPTPGQIGPSVIVGHVDSYQNISVFWRLRYVAAGDTIVVDRKDGIKATFVVNNVKQFNQTNFPTQEVYGNIKHAGLRLITCGGIFDEETQSYNQNTVVFATLL